MTDLAIIVPTKGRPGNVRKVIGAWDFTNAWDQADLVLAVDGDDPEIEGYRELVAEFKDQADNVGIESPLYLIEFSEWHPMVHKLDRAAMILAERYWALGFAGDDHLPRTIGWAPAYLAALRELRTGLVYGDDGYQGAKLCTEWAMTSDAVRALGRMVPAPVEHMYSDVSVLELFAAAGAVRHLAEVRIEHMHPIVGKADNDEQYRRVNHRDQFRKDHVIYQDWQRTMRPVQVHQVRALWPDRPVPPPAAEPEVRLGRSTKPRRTHTTKLGVQPQRSGPRVKREVAPVKRTNMAPREFRRVVGATPDEIGIALADMAAQVPADQAIVELGVYQARTALLMAWGARQGHGAHVYGVDAWDLPGNTYGPPFTDPGTRTWAHYNVKATGYRDRVTLIQAFADDAARDWSGPPIGLLFVDDDHSAEGARQAITSWAKHLAPGAVIAVDDYGHPDWPGVAEAVEALVAEGFLAPIEIFHDRLAVTRLGAGPGHIDPEPTRVIDHATAITSEGVKFEIDTSPVTSREVVTADEALRVTGVELATTLGELSVAQLRELAKVRGIVLGYRKDKRAEVLQALRDGA